jgi:transglutaminase-like putative cysteine protease
VATPLCAIRLCQLLLLASIALPSILQAGTDWAPLDPAELAMKDLPEQPGALAFVLFHQEIDNDQQGSHSVYMRIKVLSEAGRKYADVQIPYYKEESNISDIHGRTIHPDGSIVEFQGKPFDKVVVKSKNLKVRVKAFTLPDIQVGSVLEYKYTLHTENRTVWAPRWTVQSELFQRKEHFKFVPYSGTIQMAHGEIGTGLAYNSMLPRGNEVKSVRDTYELDLANVPAFVEEEHMPPPQEYKYYVRFYYRRVNDADQFWREEGKYWSSDIEKFLGKKHGISEAVAGIVSPGDTPEQKVKKIYAYVAGLDNLTYKPQRTQQEQKVLGVKDNRGVEDVLRLRSGDRQEITLLFIAMVRAAGTPAYAMYVSDRSEDVFLKTHLSLDQLDTLVAIVQIDGKDVFLDPGTKFCPYGIIDWKYTGTQGIKQLPGGGTELAQTPLPDYMKAVSKRVARLRLNDQGQVEGSLAIGYFGQEALTRRLEGSKTDDVGRTKILEDEVKSWLPSNAQVSMTKPPQWDEVETPLVAEFKISSPMLMSGGKRVLLPTNIFQFNRPPMFAHPDRKQPIYFEFPSREIDDVHIKLPDNLQVESLPANQEVKVQYAIYRASRKQDKNEIDMTRDLAIATFVFPPAEYKGLKSFFDKVKEGDDEQVLLKQVAHVAQN